MMSVSWSKKRSWQKKNKFFISSYLQDPHIYLSVVPGLHVPGLKLVKDMEFDNSKFYQIVEDPFLYQQSSKQLFCKCNRNFMISWVCLDLQYYRPISLSFKGEDLILTLELFLDYGLVHQLVCSDLSQTVNFGRKLALGLLQGFKMNKNLRIPSSSAKLQNGFLMVGQCNNQPMYHDSGKDAASVHKHQIGENVSRKDKINFLVTTVSINLENLR
ncbi:hypothetical protein CK203_064030 [Vitis vinifera]|uniref:Uncharacterized protein n=1 Tax=Vitis vinifera TaxID=29760 RepID=A0A438FRE2_VITVI|nr:hypothetical protein CK203_064030 [Vitis vinifera]